MFGIKYETWKSTCDMYFSLKLGSLKSYLQIDIYYRDIGILNFITGEKLGEAFERHINEISSKRKAVQPEGNTA